MDQKLKGIQQITVKDLTKEVTGKSNELKVLKDMLRSTNKQ
jgi:hypothetical protein